LSHPRYGYAIFRLDPGVERSLSTSVGTVAALKARAPLVSGPFQGQHHASPTAGCGSALHLGRGCPGLITFATSVVMQVGQADLRADFAHADWREHAVAHPAKRDERIFECSSSSMKSPLASSHSICASIAAANCGGASSREK